MMRRTIRTRTLLRPKVGRRAGRCGRQGWGRYWRNMVVKALNEHLEEAERRCMPSLAPVASRSRRSRLTAFRSEPDPAAFEAWLSK